MKTHTSLIEIGLEDRERKVRSWFENQVEPYEQKLREPQKKD